MVAIGPIPPLSSISALGTASPASGVAAAGSPSPSLRSSAIEPSGGASFGDAIGQVIGALNEQLLGADRAAAEFAAGGSADLHAVMLEMQEASIGLQVGVAVRDRVLEAYQSLMHLQI